MEPDKTKATISEDLGDGKQAKLDKSLRNFAKNSAKLDKSLRNFAKNSAEPSPTKYITDVIREELGTGISRPWVEFAEPMVELEARKRRRDDSSPPSDTVYQVTSDRENICASLVPKDYHSCHSTVLYQIVCSQGDPEHDHPPEIYQDMPSLQFAEPSTRTNHGHLVGHNPVLDLQSFMENDLDGTAFIIVREVECSSLAIFSVRAGNPLRSRETLYVKSRLLKETLQQIASCYFQPKQGKLTRAFDVTSIPLHPYLHHQILHHEWFLYHHLNALADYASAKPESATHIGSLLEYTNLRYGQDFSRIQGHIENGVIDPLDICYLFKPNELIISEACAQSAAFVLHEWPERDSGGSVVLHCWCFQNSGVQFARNYRTIRLSQPTKDLIRIQDLDAFPLRFAAQELVDGILTRGKKYWTHRFPKQVAYRGSDVERDQYFSDSRFMIDYQTYRRMHREANAFNFEEASDDYPFDNFPQKLELQHDPIDTHLLLMPPDIYGFYLHEKKWMHLLVDNVFPVTWNKKAFERLVLPDSTKDLIRALVSVRTSQRGIKHGLGVAGRRTDLINSKGNGLIMLLHGSPGTGKTLTGESVAEIAEMPLYRVTCGDIGHDAEAVESYLGIVLHLGKTWNCVLLLDEADVFLEERSMSDLKRNSLVSVFLRILEYYDGIFILTSNRVGTFDEAFKSRIQVALHYENLGIASRKKIWQNFFEMLDEDDEDANLHELRLHLDELASKELNGRQIRNVLTTARQLAIYKKERLDWKHLEHAFSVSSNFDEYLQRIQGISDDQRARDDGLR